MDYAIAGVEVMQMAYDASNNLEYVGTAFPGTATSAALWRIKNLTYDGSNNLTGVLWADGDTNYDNVWDDRASLSYS